MNASNNLVASLSASIEGRTGGCIAAGKDGAACGQGSLASDVFGMERIQCSVIAELNVDETTGAKCQSVTINASSTLVQRGGAISIRRAICQLVDGLPLQIKKMKTRLLM
ncbi:hypothetical protein [Burkholderia ubonensis]|uniref:hypothetical protein n=1 Tax=Burkholderia ubonensis TaxID=101571 RepID=UPI0012FBE492|nr:hypothetical protein [Burkholderia ubonensis]